MPRYTIKTAVTEIHHVTYEVEAENLYAAVDAIEQGGEGDEIDRSFESVEECDCIRVLEIDDQPVPEAEQEIDEEEEEEEVA